MPILPNRPVEVFHPAETVLSAPLSCQQRFHQRWSWVSDRHVRALVWLLDAPDLLDPAALCWHGRIATLAALTPSELAWLQRLDQRPQDLHGMLDAQPSRRLGRYAEKLLQFYLEHSGRLMAHNVQVRNVSDKGVNNTLGEFDFLLRDALCGGLIHWEFATKFYLRQADCPEMGIEAFVGPNLADSLAAKMAKIMHQQLRLSAHPAAAHYLSQPVMQAQALVKGWLFYAQQDGALPLSPEWGIAPGHCRGFWCELAELDTSQSEHYLILPRLEWLAPASAPVAQAWSAAQLRSAIAALLKQTRAPVMVALCECVGDRVLERERGFVVPDDWRARAAHRRELAGCRA